MEPLWGNKSPCYWRKKFISRFILLNACILLMIGECICMSTSSDVIRDGKFIGVFMGFVLEIWHIHYVATLQRTGIWIDTCAETMAIAFCIYIWIRCKNESWIKLIALCMNESYSKLIVVCILRTDSCMHFSYSCMHFVNS